MPIVCGTFVWEDLCTYAGRERVVAVSGTQRKSLTSGLPPNIVNVLEAKTGKVMWSMGQKEGRL